MGKFQEKFERAPIAFSFEDVILLPGFSKVEPKEVDLKTMFSKNIQLNIPVVSSPMDTVTEEEMAIALALHGGIGVIHRNCSIEEEVEMVKKVKNFKANQGSAVRDKNGKLRVAAAVSPFDIERAKALSKYVDALVIDVAHFHNENVIEATRKIAKEVNVDIVIGNLGTREGVLDAVSRIEEVAGLRVGIGSGSVCITTEITRAGAPTLFAVAQAADALEELGLEIPIIADGGIRSPGDVVLSIAFGASCAMLGYILAGCKESPSPIKVINGKIFKLHRGMGSKSAREKRMVIDRYAASSKEIPEGIEAWIPYKGDASSVISEFVAGIRAAIGYAGASSIKEVKEKAKVAKVLKKREVDYLNKLNEAMYFLE